LSDASEQRVNEKDEFHKRGFKLIVKGQRGRSKSRRPKRDLDASNSNAYYCRKLGHINKDCMNLQEDVE